MKFHLSLLGGEAVENRVVEESDIFLICRVPETTTSLAVHHDDAVRRKGSLWEHQQTGSALTSKSPGPNWVLLGRCRPAGVWAVFIRNQARAAISLAHLGFIQASVYLQLWQWLYEQEAIFFIQKTNPIGNVWSLQIGWPILHWIYRIKPQVSNLLGSLQDIQVKRKFLHSDRWENRLFICNIRGCPPYYKAYPDELFEGHVEHSGLNTTNA